MINQELLDYINQQLKQGIDKEQINAALLVSGWQAQDIEEGFSAVVGPQDNLNASAKFSKKKQKIALVIFVGAIFIGGGIYFASQEFFKLGESENLSDQSYSANSQPADNVASQKLPIDQFSDNALTLTDGCSSLSSKLSLCEKHKCQSTHSLTRGIIKREIMGMVEEKCVYVEQIFDQGKMECEFSESARKAYGEYYNDVISLESLGIMINPENSERRSYVMDGKTVDNPLQEAISSGMCEVFTY